MARFFISKDQLDGDKALVMGADVRHITKVLRLQRGDSLTLVDEQGTEYQATITGSTPDTVECRVLAEAFVNREPPVEIVLCQGLPKGDKLELIIQKAVELGVSRIIPITTSRTVVQLKDDKAAKRLERWRKVAQEAAKQCRRNSIPEVAPLMGLQEALQRIPDDALAVIPWEEAQGVGLKKVLVSNNRREQIWIIIGPEGGLTQEEVCSAIDGGVTPVSLGPRILRTETAAIAATTMVLYELGDLGGTSN